MARFHVPQPHGFASRLSPGLALVVTPPRGNDRAAQQREIDLRVQWSLAVADSICGIYGMRLLLAVK